MLSAVLTTIVGIGFVFVSGVLYIKWYKKNVLDKMELAFTAGYDPALELATHPLKGEMRIPAQDPKPSTVEEDDLQIDPGWTEHLRRKEQDLVDRIIHGKEAGHYFVLMGPKGSGKTSMIFDAMRVVQADGIAMCDAHPDLEVFRLRLGVALNYEFNEDTQSGLFQRRDPREAGPSLDIERAMNKLEKVAIRCYRRRHKPLVLIINNVHFFHNNEDGRNMLLQLQQRAESWAASGILTVVFATDDFWPFNLLRERASRMHVVPIYDLDNKEALRATNLMRQKIANVQAADQEELHETIKLLGGRLAYLSKAAKARNMTEMAKYLLTVEKASVLSQIGLIEDHDDDVMDEQKWSSCSWLLLQEFVKIRKEQEQEREEDILAGKEVCDLEDLPLPKLPYWRCREVMTRTDFLEELDRLNIISVDVHHDIRPDSMLIMHAAREVVEEEGFEEKLNNVRDRIDDIESLHRTRELTFKDVKAGDRIRLVVDKGGAELVED